jgi:ABC-type polysaccharide/polyol phosphate transport system ATPase subunit
MYLRLAFAIAAHLDADILLIDEVLAVGDESFQRKCEERIARQIAAGATLVLVSHDAALVERSCARTVVLDGGRVAFDGPTAQAMPFYHRLMGTPDPQPVTP